MQSLMIHDTDDHDEAVAYIMKPPHTPQNRIALQKERYITAVTTAPWVNYVEKTDGQILAVEAECVLAYGAVTELAIKSRGARIISCTEHGFYDGGEKINGVTHHHMRKLGLPPIAYRSTGSSNTATSNYWDWDNAWFNESPGLMSLICSSELPRSHAIIAMCMCVATSLKYIDDQERRSMYQEALITLNNYAYGSASMDDVVMIERAMSPHRYEGDNRTPSDWQMCKGILEITKTIKGEKRSTRTYHSGWGGGLRGGGDLYDRGAGVSDWNGSLALGCAVGAAAYYALTEAANEIRKTVKLPDICYAAMMKVRRGPKA